VLSVIPDVTLRPGFMSLAHSYILVFTEQRIIFVRERTSALRKVSDELSAQAKAQGKGHAGQLAASMGAFDVLAASYADRSPEEILADDPETFAIERSTISKVKTKSNVGDSIEDRLTIKTGDKSYKMVLHQGMKQAQRALKAAGLR
jgi:hypothetical protein